jgi:hypothetical protein
MRRTAIPGLFALVAVAMVFTQTPAGAGIQPNQIQNASGTNQQSNPAQPANTNSSTAKQATTPESTLAAPTSMQDTPPASAAGIDRVDAGTEIRAALDTPLSTRTSKPGDRFTAAITGPVRANNGAVVIPSGARIEGEVAEAEEGKTVAALRGKGTLNLRFRNVTLPNGQTLPLTASLVSVHDTSGKSSRKLDQDGQMQSGTRGQDAKDVGIGAGTDAGVIFGGPLKGLAIGSLAGGGYVLAIKGKDVNLPAQTGMVIRLDQPVSWDGASASPQR